MSSQPEFNFTSISSVLTESVDICANRHRGNPESQDAHEKVKYGKREMYEKILRLAQARKEFGITVHEVSHQFGKTPNEVSGRLSELKMMGKLKKSGVRRNGCAVLILS